MEQYLTLNEAIHSSWSIGFNLGYMMGWGDVAIFCSSKCWYKMDYGRKNRDVPSDGITQKSRLKSYDLNKHDASDCILKSQDSRVTILTNMIQVIVYSCKQHETFQLDCILNTNILQIAEKDTHGIFYLLKTSRYIFTVTNLSFLIALKKLHVYCGSSINITQKLRLNIYIMLLHFILCILHDIEYLYFKMNARGLQAEY